MGKNEPGRLELVSLRPEAGAQKIPFPILVGEPINYDPGRGGHG